MTSVGQGATDVQRRQWAVGLIAFVLAVGTVGYMLLGLDFADAMYQTGITITTVGFGEVTSGGEPSEGYRWFTLALVLGGATAVVFAAGVVIEMMVDQRAGVFRERRMQRQISAMRGVQLNLDDRIRAWIIERLMCDFAFSFDALEDRFGYAARSYIAEAKIAVANDTFGLCHIDGNSFAIREEARPFTRIVASWFDAYLNDSSVRYSKAV